MQKQYLITVNAPENCSDEQFDEWIKFCTGYQASINMSNPLSGYDLEVTQCEEY